MTRTRLLWMAVVVAIAVVVAWQVVGSSGERAQFVAQADIPTVAPGVDEVGGDARHDGAFARPVADERIR